MNSSANYPFLPEIKIRILLWAAIIIIPAVLSGAVNKTYSILTHDKVVVYKLIDTLELKLYIYNPSVAQSKEKAFPAIVFFFGGGWNGGDITQFEPHAKHFASLGMVAILGDYRVRERHGTTPFDAVADAKSVFRFLRKHSDLLNIDPNRIVGSGGSAGGHIAAAAAMVSALDDPDDDLSISPVPDALVLFNPVFDNGPDGYGFERIGNRYLEISPIHNIRPGNPPTIVFLGTNDRLIPVSTAEKFRDLMLDSKNKCELHLYEGQGHGFFNYRHKDNYIRTVATAEAFLLSIGFID
jgi:acetyl esterase